MQKLSLRKQLTIVRLYLKGLPYDEIVARAGVSKGTVANVVAELKAGRILVAQEAADELELLREVAVDLRRLKLTSSQALAGLAILSHLNALGLEPADIQRWAAMCRQMAATETGAQAFVRAALALEEARERTGLSIEELEQKVHSLQDELARLEPLAEELRGCEHQLEQMRKQRQALAEEISQLEKRLEPLRKGLTEKERREAELYRRLQKLEEQAQAADERLSTARRDLKELAGLGLPLDDLHGFAGRLAAVSQRHGIEPGALRDRLLHELEELDVGLGVESHVELRRRELDEIEQATAKSQEERVALDSALQQLRQQQASLHAAITEEQAHVRNEMRATARIARDAVSKLKPDLRNAVGEALLEVQSLRNQTLELGQEVGRYDATVEANQWIQSLLALVRGDGGISAGDVRVVALAVLRGVKGWLQQNQPQTSLPYWLAPKVDSAMQELEQWKV